MGVKDLWSVLTPYAERKPICELRGKVVAIDLAGWVCESLNVVDYFVHPRHHLKNLFFRTCYLIWEEVTPVFVLEGTAPKLKSQVIAKRNELQFRGVKPRENVQKETSQNKGEKGRTRFNHVLKQCETLLKAIGIQCVQGPGEAEAYCAFLNKCGLVDGVISQDSDCFAYGAILVYRNFSVSNQGAQAAQGGAVDIYDMRRVREKMDFGQQKIIVMALLCGCDYCPEGIGGVGRDGVLKLFNKYKDEEILERIRSWRREDSKYTALEMRVDDKTICTNCGHLGRTQSHTKSGCGICRTSRGCDESLWKEQRLSLKAELMLRKKALADDSFPSEEIVQEFLTQPEALPNLNLGWGQPNIVKFIKQIGHLLQWQEIYCFQKFFPILTRWQVRNFSRLKDMPLACSYVEPKEIIKKRTVKGVASLEIYWVDKKGFFQGLIPDDQLGEFELDHPKGRQELWTTVEPFDMVQQSYPDMVTLFLQRNEKPKKTLTRKNKIKNKEALSSLENLQDLIAATDHIAAEVKPKGTQKKAVQRKGLQMIDKFFKQKPQIPDEKIGNTPKNNVPMNLQCSTPRTKYLSSDMESDVDEELNMSEIVNGIVSSSIKPEVTHHDGRALLYESITQDISLIISKEKACDDLDLSLMTRKRKVLTPLSIEKFIPQKKVPALDDSFDVLVKKESEKLNDLIQKAEKLIEQAKPASHAERFKQQHKFSIGKFQLPDENKKRTSTMGQNMSFFFDTSASSAGNFENEDVFEKLMELNLSLKPPEEDLVLIIDSD